MKLISIIIIVLYSTLFVLSIVSGKMIGWVTDDFGVTIAFLALIFSMYQIANVMDREMNNE